MVFIIISLSSVFHQLSIFPSHASLVTDQVLYGSLAHSMLRFTLSGLAEEKRVLAIRGLLMLYCKATLSMGSWCSAQYCAALAQAATSGLGAGCQSGTPREVRSPMANGEALMTPMPCCS